MDRRSGERGMGTSKPVRREPHQRRAGGRRFAGCAMGLAVLAVLAGLGLCAVLWLATPRLAPATEASLPQPGGTLHQVTSSDVYSLSWSSDGRRLALTVEATDNAWRYMGLLTWYGIRRASKADPFPPRFSYLALVGTDGEDPQAFRMPGRWSCNWALWQPAGGQLAVSADRLAVSRDGLDITSGAWLFDVDQRRFSQLASCRNPISWSPDGLTMLCSYAQPWGGAHGYRCVNRAGTEFDLPTPPKPSWISRPRWSPSSRLLAFRYYAGHRTSNGRSREKREGAIWIVDLETRKPRLIGVGEAERLVWLSDGRLIAIHSQRDKGGPATTRMGAVSVEKARIEWFPWQLPYVCAAADEAGGRIVLKLTSGVAQRDGQVRLDLWELRLSDGSLRRLTDLGFVRGWRLSPSGDQVALIDVPALPGLWVLDMDPSLGAARQGNSGRHPAVE